MSLLVAKGVVAGLGGYLASKLVGPKKKIPDKLTWFKPTEMKYFFVSAALYPFVQAIFWDYMIEEELNGHYNKTHRKKLFIASALYASVIINPSKMKWLIIPMMIGKLIAFKDWIIDGKSFRRPQDVYLFGDGIWLIGFAMAFQQLILQRKVE